MQRRHFLAALAPVAAAPFGALLAKRLRPRLLLGTVAVVLMATSLYSVARAWPIF